MTQELRVRLITALVLCLVFAAGIALGMAVDRPVTEPPEARAGSTPPSEAIGTADRPVTRSEHDRVMKRIDLTRAQRVAVDSLLRFYQEQMAELQQEYGPRYWAIVDSSRYVIKELLNEEQAMLYDSLLVENDKRRGRPGSSNDRP